MAIATHEKSATRNMCNMETEKHERTQHGKVQDEKNATLRKLTQKKVQHEKS